MDPDKKKALLITLLLVALFALPGVRNLFPRKYRARDSFPVSTFPMFSKKRPPEHRMTWVRGRDAGGAVVDHHLRSWAYDAGGMNQAMAHLRPIRKDDAARRDKMCRRIAERVGRVSRYQEVVTVEVVDAWYRPEKVFGPDRDETPERAEVLVTCAVEREPETGGTP